MSNFLVDLVNSIFTPGPTRPLIVATNYSFAGLQLVLFILLVVTYSVHFLTLSFLSAGLWWAINWFVRELAAAQAVEEARKSANLSQGQSNEDSDTDTETVIQTGTTGSKAVEVVDNPAELKPRGSPFGSKSELSTEDEWERVSEDEKNK